MILLIITGMFLVAAIAFIAGSILTYRRAYDDGFADAQDAAAATDDIAEIRWQRMATKDLALESRSLAKA